jgi:hypothetical protein
VKGVEIMAANWAGARKHGWRGTGRSRHPREPTIRIIETSAIMVEYSPIPTFARTER